MSEGTIVAVGHVVIRTGDLQRCLAFYRDLLGLKQVIKGDYFNAFEVGLVHFCVMPGKPGEATFEELVRIWRKVWDELKKVNNRIDLAFSRFENPSHEDLELADRLREQEGLAWAKMKEFQANLINRQRGSDSP